MKRLLWVWLAALGVCAAAEPPAGFPLPTRTLRWINPGETGGLAARGSYGNEHGRLAVVNASGAVDATGHPFFTALGSNGRACVSCHQPQDGMGLSLDSIRRQWLVTAGSDPIFAAIDGSDCPSLPQAAASSHSLLLNHGLFRVFLPWPPRDATGQAIRPEFTLELLRDPTGCNSDPRHGLRSATPMVSVYRRPRIAANLTRPGLIVMADGRAPTLAAQAADATATHMQRREPLTAGQLQDMVDFESQVSVSQTQPRRGTEESVERGRQLFAQREFRKPGSTTPQTCAGCHAAVTQDADTTTYPSEPPDTGLPLFRIRCGKSPPLYTQDPGRALVTGRCADVGALVTQALPGIASHPPYFANGMAGTLRDVVVFYDRRYGMGLSPAEMDDLANYLGSL